ncbi:MAG: hypothetical protein U0Q19_04555 [Kineosporiaceae bacterium]
MPAPLSPSAGIIRHTAGGLALAVVTGLSAYSVVRYRPAIVAGYLVAAVVLAVVLVRSRRPHRSGAGQDREARWGPAAALIGSGLITGWVPAFTYLTPDAAARVRWILAGAGVLSGLLVLIPGEARGRWTPRRAADAALALAIIGYLGATVLLLRGDPAPEIDVWYTLQGAADSLARGRDIYREVWVGPPGVMAAFTYLPWTALLLAPGRWLAGDVRVALTAISVLAVLVVRGMHRPGRDPRITAGAAALLLLLPGTATQVEQAWTEPLLAACLVVAVHAVLAGRWTRAILALAIGMACKQHLVLLLPLLAAWPRFGVRRAMLTAAATGVAVLPWFLADPAAMIEDTVAVLVRYPPMRFADSLYIAAINEFGWMPPFWLTGVVVLAVLVAVAGFLRRHDPGPGDLLCWAALVLLVANLVNKQAFYNQYWLVAAMVAVGWAVTSATEAPVRAERP